MTTLFERTGSTVLMHDQTITIPDDMSALSILSENNFIPNGEYRNDGFIYVNNKPVKKWFRNIDDVSVWFPIIDDLHVLQNRFYKILSVYKKYHQEICLPAYNKLKEVGKAHALISHNFTGDFDPWWLYTVRKYGDHEGVSFDWVEKPSKPINLEIGNDYYIKDKRLEQIGKRVHKFRTVFKYAINTKLFKIKGEQGQVIQLKIDDRVYWFRFINFSWEELAFPEDNVKVLTL